MDHRIKLDWARQHLEAFRSDMRAFLERSPHAMTCHFDPARAKYVVYLYVREPVPSHFASRVGDIAHNVRSALDSLTYALACKALGRIPTGREVKQIQFVIVDDQADWGGECGRRLAHVAPEARAVIERLQPYNNRPEPKWQHVLSTLRDLSNIDKHRHLIIVGHAALDAGVTVRASGPPLGDTLIGTVSGWSGPFENETEIATFDFAGRDGIDLPREEHPEMEVKGQITFDVAFGDGPPGYGSSVTRFCAGAISYAEKIAFPALEPFLA